MNIGNYLKKRFNFFIISAIFIGICLIITFIFLTKNHFNQDILINNKNIQVTFENGKKGIKFGEYPMSYEQGLSLSPDNKFKVVNKSNMSVDYEVVVTEIAQDIETLDMSKVVACVNDDTCMMLDEAEDGVIYTSSLSKNFSDILNLKFWVLKEKIQDSDLDKTILLNVDVREK